MTGGAAVAAGVLLVAGLFALVSGLRRTWAPRAPRKPDAGADGLWARLSRRPPGARGRRRDVILLASLIGGFVLAAVSGWLVLILVVPSLTLGLPYLLVLPPQRDVAVMEALDRWVRGMAATLTTGRSVADAIRLSRRTAPALLADELAVVVARLNSRWTVEDALRRFADALGSPDVDAVIAALVLSANRGSVGASQTLQALADSLQDQLKARRLIEAERAKPYVVVRQVTVITLVVLGAAFVFNSGFFSAYRSPVGQLVLSVLVSAYLGSLLLMRRRARQRPRDRLLVARQP